MNNRDVEKKIKDLEMQIAELKATLLCDERILAVTKKIKELKYKSYSTVIGENYYKKLQMLSKIRECSVSNLIKEFIEEHRSNIYELLEDKDVTKERGLSSHCKNKEIVSVALDKTNTILGFGDKESYGNSSTYKVLRNIIYAIIVQNKYKLQRIIDDKYVEGKRANGVPFVWHDLKENKIIIHARLPQSVMFSLDSTTAVGRMLDTICAFSYDWIKPSAFKKIPSKFNDNNELIERKIGEIEKINWDKFVKICYFFNLNPDEAVENICWNIREKEVDRHEW